MNVAIFKPRQSFASLRPFVASGGAAATFGSRISVSGHDRNDGDYVLYWMQSARRIEQNLALEHAITIANEARLPVVIYDTLRPDYPEANDRIHTFVLQSVAGQYAAAAARGLRYHFFLPRATDEADAAIALLASRARVVVTDEFPTATARKHTALLRAATSAPIHLVDGNGVLPMRVFAAEQYSAKFFRDKAHRLFEHFWSSAPRVEPRTAPFTGELDLPLYDGSDPESAAAECQVDHIVAPVALRGGRREALERLATFIEERLDGYAERRNREPDRTSGLSPYLHFGFISAEEVARNVLLSDAPIADIDAFLEELIIRRELSFNFCFFRSDHDSLGSLPQWARTTLDRHRADRRKPSYSYEELERAETHDEVWNLSQRALLATGTMHNYLRMLWGKKIIEWSPTPEEAHATMLRLHARYALDGRDPNTHAGVLWCFGKHDRAWAPQRPIFGTIRYMSSDSTRRKVDLRAYERLVSAAELVK